MTIPIKRQYIIGFVVVMLLSLANVASVFAQVTIDSPASGTTITGTQYLLFEQNIELTGDAAPFVFTATGLPDGIGIEVDELEENGRFVGAPSESGTFSVLLTVQDSAEPPDTDSDMVSFTIEITAVGADDIDINVPDVFEITEGTVGEAYPTLQFSTDEDAIEDRFEWNIDEDDLPEGMAIDPITGSLIGIPTESGEFFFTVEVTDPATANTGARAYKLTVTGSIGTSDLEIVSPSGSSLPSGVLNRTYTADVDASGGTGIYEFEASGLPGGLSINSSTGIISGRPNSTGTFNVDIIVTDSDDDTATREYTLEIEETGNAVYDSDPDPGSTLDFGNVNIGASFTQTITVDEDGTDQLDVSAPSGGVIQGTDADNFTIVTNSPPFSIADGGADVSVAVRCSPDEARDFNAILQFITNDEDNAVVVYTLFCTGVTEGGSADDDTDTDDGTGATAIPAATFTPAIPTQTPLPPTYGNVIEVRGLSLRTAPFIGATRRTVLRPEINYRVTAKNNEEGVYMWYYIITDDGIDGWASGRYLAVYGQDVPFAGSVMDNVFTERDRGVRVQALDNLNFRPAPSDRTQPYPDLIPWGAQLTVYARTVSGRGDEWLAVGYNGVFGWVYAPNTTVVEGLMDAIPIY